LIKPPKGKVLVEIDFRSQEFGIAAYLSKDPNMIEAYLSGDPYLSFGKQVGYIPENGTKKTHGDRREVMKTVILGCQYGMGEDSLARRLDTTKSEARRRLTQHKRIYRKYWGFVDNYIDQARNKEVSTALGWKIRANSKTKPRTIGNFPTQGSGSDVLRVTVLNLDEAGFEMIGVIHDAVAFLMNDDEHLEANVEQAKEIMRRSSKSVIGDIIEVDSYTLRPEKNWLEGIKTSFWEEVLDCVEPDDKVENLKEYLK
jgi:DNA polymerase I-like protein with 3'-5' exonuclease and polymerase domains